MNDLPVYLYTPDGVFVKETSWVPNDFTGIVNNYGDLKYYINGKFSFNNKRITKEQHRLLVDTMKLKGLL